jgi:hypothetical protein
VRVVGWVSVKSRFKFKVEDVEAKQHHSTPLSDIMAEIQKQLQDLSDEYSKLQTGNLILTCPFWMPKLTRFRPCLQCADTTKVRVAKTRESECEKGNGVISNFALCFDWY